MFMLGFGISGRGGLVTWRVREGMKVGLKMAPDMW